MAKKDPDPTDNPAILAGLILAKVQRGEIDREEGEPIVNQLCDEAKKEGLYE